MLKYKLPDEDEDDEEPNHPGGPKPKN